MYVPTANGKHAMLNSHSRSDLFFIEWARLIYTFIEYVCIKCALWIGSCLISRHISFPWTGKSAGNLGKYIWKNVITLFLIFRASAIASHAPSQCHDGFVYPKIENFKKSRNTPLIERIYKKKVQTGRPAEKTRLYELQYKTGQADFALPASGGNPLKEIIGHHNKAMT